MHLNRLDLNLLVVLDALLTEKSVTKASKLIHLSQPATSGALSRLREYFGDDILVRIGSKMVLTPLGESLAIPVNNILLQIQATVEKRPEFEPMHSDRNFNFMLSDYTNAIFVPKLLQRAFVVAPKVKFEFTQLYDAPQEALEKGKIDFLLLPEFALSSNHPSCHLFAEDYVCVGDINNTALEDNFSLEKFLSLGHVTTKFGTQLQPSIIDTILEERNIKTNVEVITPSFTSIPQVIVGTNRIAVMHRRLATKWAEYLPLKVVPVPLELPTMNWGLQWHQYRDHDPGTMWMKEFIINTVPLL
ncbi:MAG: nodulation protein NfeD [Alteromonadaceae bacterium]|uniref:LysR family transcriptional regulator n=1 Tax=Paraglaciecola chathamensis TaxID=368405 RepID=UPI000C48DF47|nr:LysR family transcriptional regulator [Paraglaciecola agarilytica]MBN27829.1 nodulation protein NfeD [Alteromonadaceae bacterium]|tara:strand:+ start:6786 stop:7691 length:906 start_codon:yes stop_codon:yes gene_type:complete